MKQFALKAKGCTGRGVRIVELTPAQRATIKAETAKTLTAESTRLEWMELQVEQGICAMVVQVTEKEGFFAKDALLAEGIVWKKYSSDAIEAQLPTLFNAKDRDALGKIFQRLHDVTDEEVDDILGEAQEVTAD